MLALPSMLGGIERLEIGRDQLHDARSWDLILIMQFQSVAALRGYQQHPEHRAVMQFNDPHVAQIASVDFESPSTVLQRDLGVKLTAHRSVRGGLPRGVARRFDAPDNLAPMQPTRIALGLLALIVLGSVVAACGRGSTAQGGERQRCYPNGTCNSGLTCASDVCVDRQQHRGHDGRGRRGREQRWRGGTIGTVATRPAPPERQMPLAPPAPRAARPALQVRPAPVAALRAPRAWPARPARRVAGERRGRPERRAAAAPREGPVRFHSTTDLGERDDARRRRWQRCRLGVSPAGRCGGRQLEALSRQCERHVRGRIGPHRHVPAQSGPELNYATCGVCLRIESPAVNGEVTCTWQPAGTRWLPHRPVLAAVYRHDHRSHLSARQAQRPVPVGAARRRLHLRDLSFSFDVLIF